MKPRLGFTTFVSSEPKWIFQSSSWAKWNFDIWLNMSLIILHFLDDVWTGQQYITNSDLIIFQNGKKKLITLLTIEGRNIRLRKFLAVSGHSWWKSQLWEFWVGRVASLALSVAGRAELHVKKYHFPLPLKEIQFVGGIFTPIVFSCHWCHVRAWSSPDNTSQITPPLFSPLCEGGMYSEKLIKVSDDHNYRERDCLKCWLRSSGRTGVSLLDCLWCLSQAVLCGPSWDWS